MVVERQNGNAPFRALARMLLPTMLASLLLSCEQRIPPTTAKRTAATPTASEHHQSDKATARKQRSLAVLQREGVPFIEHLPVIETAAAAKSRSIEEVTQRAIALYIVAVKATGAAVAKLTKEFQTAASFSSAEQKFLSNRHPSDLDRTAFSWRYEAYSVMAWSLGLVETLDKPVAVCNVEKLQRQFQQLGRAGSLWQAKLRPLPDILDAADLIYRYHWAVEDARLNHRKPPAGLDPDVVQERHYALNWLIGYLGQEWDEVTPDT